MLEATLFVLAGTLLYAGAHHLYLGVARTATDRHLQIGAMYLLLAGFTMTSALFHQSQDFSTQLYSARLSMSVEIMLWGVLIWYVAFYTNCKPLLLLDVLTAAWLILLIENVTAANGLLSAGTMQFAWHPGEAVTGSESAAKSWWIAIKYVTLASLLFCFYASFRMLRCGERRAALILAGGLLILAAAALTGHLLDSLANHSLTLTPLGFFGFLLANSLYVMILDNRQRRKASVAPPVQGLPSNTERTTFKPHLLSPQVSADQQSAALVAQPAETAAERQPAVTPSPAGLASDDGAEVVRVRAHKLAWSQSAAVEETPAAIARRVEAYSLITVSDNLMDIAVYATLARNRLERGDADPQHLRALSEKIRRKAIDTRRMANKLSRPS